MRMRAFAAEKADEVVFLDAAASIGRDILEQAVWDGGRCNWVGAAPEEARAGEVVMTYAALGPGLYDGTSGIALFLSHLSAATGDADARRTALGAIRQALTVEDDRRPASPSVYTGMLGVALAAAETGRVLSEDGLIEDAARLVPLVVEAPSVEFDLLLGQAGGIVGLLALHQALGDRRWLDHACDLGHDLVRRGRKRGRRLSWGSPTVRGEAHLTGLSHGAAGAALALIELARVTGDSSFREATTAAFAYEQHVFDAEEQNWPDYRALPARPRRAQSTPFATFWCHGAPGIALSRLRSIELSGDPAAREDAQIALGTTERAVRGALRNHTGNFSLCHGLAGNAEVLTEGPRVLGSECPAGAGVARQGAETGVERYGSAGSWPSGAYGGQTPSLFLGLAGVGLFYLRLANPAVPSVVVIRPEAFRAGSRRTP